MLNALWSPSCRFWSYQHCQVPGTDSSIDPANISSPHRRKLTLTFLDCCVSFTVPRMAQPRIVRTAYGSPTVRGFLRAPAPRKRLRRSIEGPPRYTFSFLPSTLTGNTCNAILTRPLDGIISFLNVLLLLGSKTFTAPTVAAPADFCSSSSLLVVSLCKRVLCPC